jgi:hypothetical protein
MKYPKTSKHGIPHFHSFACSGDSVSWTPKKNNPHGLTITARLEHDTDTKPSDNGCYSVQKVKDWENDKWSFVGVVLSVHKDGVTLDDHAASLWGIECNYNARSNLYFARVCKELESEALAVGNEVLAKLIGE